jgi:hypothetical protein
MKNCFLMAAVLVVSQVPCLALSLDLTNSGAQVQAADTIRLRNINVVGFGNYWADFKWNPDKNQFELIDGKLDTLPQFAATSKRYLASSGIGPTLPNFNQACSQEFGAQYQQADWQDIKSAIGGDANTLQSFKNTTAVVPNTYYYIKYGNQSLTATGLMNLLYSNNSSAGNVADNIQGDVVVAQKSGSSLNGQVICIKVGNSTPFAK